MNIQGIFSTKRMTNGTSIVNKDLLALKAFIQAKDATQYDDLPSDMVLLDLTHSNLIQQHIEIRFYRSDTLDTLRTRIHQKTGTPHVYQHLQIYSAGICMTEIPPDTDENLPLGYFSLSHGMRIHCLDLDPYSGSRGGKYEDVSLVEKYRMSDEAYNQRKGTIRDWERKQRDRDPTFSLRKHAAQHAELQEARRRAKWGLELPKGFMYDEEGKVIRVEEENKEEESSENGLQGTTVVAEEEYDITSVSGIEVGMRCEVQPGGRRGQVKFVGDVKELVGGYWVGVVFDEPLGKTDGCTPCGVRYFDAPGKQYGGFVRGKNVNVGDFPERDIFEEEDSDDEL
jgi:tubulin-specific chaperone B